jgi:hypothetical protein
MGPVAPVDIEFTTITSLDNSRKIIIESLKASGAKIKIESDADIVAGFGSVLKIRMFGVFFAGIQAFPRDLVVALSTEDGRTRIKVTVRDTCGFGFRVGVTDKVQKLLYEDALNVKALFSDSTT